MRREYVEIVNLPCARLMTSWRVCHLDMLNLSNVFVQGSNQISLHTLLVVDIVLVLEIRAVHLSKKLYCFMCVCEEVARSIKDVESFGNHINMSSYGLISSPGQILPYAIHLRFTRLSRNYISDERI